VLASGARYRTEACLLGPPELFPDVMAWVKTSSPSDGAYVDCVALLLRAHRATFEELVQPAWKGDVGLTQQLAVRLPADERAFVLPVLEAATRDRNAGRDELFRLACATEQARSAPACRGPAQLEQAWDRARRLKRRLAGMAPHLALAALYAAFVIGAGWRGRHPGAVRAAAVVGSAVTAAALAWFILGSPTPGAGALNGLNTLFGLVGAVIAVPVGGVIGWAALGAKLPPRVWCLAQVVLYPLIVYAYLRALD